MVIMHHQRMHRVLPVPRLQFVRVRLEQEGADFNAFAFREFVGRERDIVGLGY